MRQKLLNYQIKNSINNKNQLKLKLKNIENELNAFKKNNSNQK